MYETFVIYFCCVLFSAGSCLCFPVLLCAWGAYSSLSTVHVLAKIFVLSLWGLLVKYHPLESLYFLLAGSCWTNTLALSERKFFLGESLYYSSNGNSSQNSVWWPGYVHSFSGTRFFVLDVVSSLSLSLSFYFSFFLLCLVISPSLPTQVRGDKLTSDLNLQ